MQQRHRLIDQTLNFREELIIYMLGIVKEMVWCIYNNQKQINTKFYLHKQSFIMNYSYGEGINVTIEYSL